MKGQKCGWVGTGWCVTNSEIGSKRLKRRVEVEEEYKK